MAEGERPSFSECIELTTCLFKAIEELWSKRLIHRDVKPQNVIKLNDPGRPFVLLDLGIAFSLTDPALTLNEKYVPATYRYLAPEMVSPNFRANLDYRSDLYSSALTIFEYAAYEHPLAKSGDDMIRTVSRAVYEIPKPLRKCREDLSPEYCALIDQLLKKKVALRGNLKQMLTRLERMS